MPSIAAEYETLGALIQGQAQRYGDKTALRFDGRETSYAELDALSEKIALALLSENIVPGDRVGWLGKNSDLYYALLLGASRVGAVMTPVNWRLAEVEIHWILNDASIRLLFLGAEWTASAESLSHHVKTLDRCVVVDSTEPSQTLTPWLDAANAGIEAPKIDPSAAAIQLYTSGTTGHPKGAVLSHRASLAFKSLPAEAQPEWNRWTDDDVSLIVMPQFHISGTGFGLQTLCAGATGIVAREFEPGQVLDFIDSARLSKIFLAPTAMHMLLQHPRARKVDYSRIRTVLYGASPIPLEQLRDAMDVFDCGFCQQYGMTESGGSICALPPEDHDANGNDRMASTGKALIGVDIIVVDESGQRLNRGNHRRDCFALADTYG